jgi:hypothetical protein
MQYLPDEVARNPPYAVLVMHGRDGLDRGSLVLELGLELNDDVLAIRGTGKSARKGGRLDLSCLEGAFVTAAFEKADASFQLWPYFAPSVSASQLVAATLACATATLSSADVGKARRTRAAAATANSLFMTISLRTRSATCRGKQAVHVHSICGGFLSIMFLNLGTGYPSAKAPYILFPGGMPIRFGIRRFHADVIGARQVETTQPV